jgi:hypothetical protein
MNSEILKARTKAYSISIGKLIIELPNNILNRNYANQLVRCSSSVGNELLSIIVSSIITIRKNEQNRKLAL